MPTRTLATKGPTRKAAAPQPTAKRKALRGHAPARKKPPQKTAPAATDDPSLLDLGARLGKIELAGLAGKLVQGWRKDLESIMQASRKSYAGLQEIVHRQTAQIKEAVGELKTVGTVMAEVGTKESARNLDKLALASLELALADIRELAALAASSQRDAFDIVHRRVTENIDEVQHLLRK